MSSVLDDVAYAVVDQDDIDDMFDEDDTQSNIKKTRAKKAKQEDDNV